MQPVMLWIVCLESLRMESFLESRKCVDLHIIINIFYLWFKFLDLHKQLLGCILGQEPSKYEGEEVSRVWSCVQVCIHYVFYTISIYVTFCVCKHAELYISSRKDCLKLPPLAPCLTVITSHLSLWRLFTSPSSVMFLNRCEQCFFCVRDSLHKFWSVDLACWHRFITLAWQV